MKEFTTAIKEVTGEADEPLEFSIDGEQLRCYNPTDGQFAMLMAATGRHVRVHDQIAGIINFFVEIMDEPSHTYIVNRLLDRSDPFGLEEVTAIIEWLTEEWTGHPTQSPSVSTRSRQSAGSRSTRRTSA